MRKIKLKAAVLSVLAAINTMGCGPPKGQDTLVWVVPGERSAEFDKIENRISDISSKRLGVDVEFEFLPVDRYANRITAKMEQGGIDIFFCGYLDNFRQRARDGDILKLDELIRETPTLKETLPDYAWEAATVDGSIYGIPNLQISSIATAVVLNKPLVDKYGFDISTIKSTKDVEPFLKILKENEPTVTPVRLNWGLGGVRTTESNTFVEYEESGVYIVNDNREIKVQTLEDFGFVKEQAELLHDWFEKGYTRSDVAVTMTEEQELRDGKFGIWFETYKPGVELQRKLMTGNEVYAVPVSKPYMDSTAGQGAMTAISAATENPEGALKLLEIVNTEPEILNLLTYGIEGENYTKKSDNVVQRNEENTFSQSTWLFGNQFIVYTEPEQGEDIWTKTKEMNESAIRSPLRGFSPDLAKVTGEMSECNSVILNYSCMEFGLEDPDDYWDKMVSEMKRAGMDTIKAEIQKQLDEFLSGST